VQKSQFRAQAVTIEINAEIEAKLAKSRAEIDHKKAICELKIKINIKMADIEMKIFNEIVKVIGSETLIRIAKVTIGAFLIS